MTNRDYDYVPEEPTAADPGYAVASGPITYVGDIGALAAALAKAQGAMPPPKRSGVNSFFKRDNAPSKYATMSDLIHSIRAPLAENGIAFTQHAIADGKQVTVTTVIMHASGARMSSALACDAKDASVQSVGSAITYLRRYGLISIAGQAGDDIEDDVVDDDDGNAAMGRRPADAPAPPAETKKPAGRPRASRGAELPEEREPRSATADPERAEDELWIDRIIAEVGKSRDEASLTELMGKSKRYLHGLKERDERSYKKVLAAFTARRVDLNDTIPV
jgi:hypothetical protein